MTGSRAAYQELERALYDGRAVTTVAAPLLGIALDVQSTEVPLGEGLSLVRGDALEDAPSDAVWGEGEEPNVMIVLTVAQERAAPAPVSVAPSPLSPHADRAAPVRAGRVRAWPDRMDADRRRRLAFGTAWRKRSAAPAAAHRRRAGGRAEGVLQPGGAARAAQRRDRLGPGPVRDGLRATGTVRGADRLPAGAAGAARARRLLEWTSRRSARRDLPPKPEDRAEAAERVAHAISLERAVIIGGLGARSARGGRAGREAVRAPPCAVARRAVRASRRGPVRGGR